MVKTILIMLLFAVRLSAQENLSAGIMLIYTNAVPLADFVVAGGSEGPRITFWNTNKLGPVPSPSQLQAASSNAAVIASIELAKVQLETAEKTVSLQQNNTKDISYALLKAIQHVTILAKWTNYPVTLNTIRTNVPTFAIVRVNYDLAVTGAPVRLAALGEFDGGFVRIDQQGGSRGTNFYSMTVLLVPDQRWYFTNITGGGSLTLVNSAMMTLSLQP